MNEPGRFSIEPVQTPGDVAAAVGLLRAYAASLDVDLAYQNFENELASLPGKYASPAGALLLARGVGGRPLGCVAMRPGEPPVRCEMKRLYVDASARGMGLGRALVTAIVVAAKTAGYGEIVLDTLPSMTEAIALYRKTGFEIIAPYYASPVAGTLFLRRHL